MAKRFFIEIEDDNRLYECKVEAQKHKEGMSYHVDILSPKQKQINGHLVQAVYNIEMYAPDNSDDFKIKEYVVPVPEELKKIEKKLSKALGKLKDG